MRWEVERRYARTHGCDPATLAAGRGAHLHTTRPFPSPPPPMTMKTPTIGNHNMMDVWQSYRAFLVNLSSRFLSVPQR
jgi:hypothetical protein